MNFSKTIRQKTTWAVLATILAAVGGMVTGETSVSTGMQIIGAALIGFFIRDGIQK